MNWDRFDIVEAHYLFLTHYHEGQCSDSYRRLCKILTYFKPAPSGVTLTENGQEIYNNLVLQEKAYEARNIYRF
jgi:hypothetical protein